MKRLFLKVLAVAVLGVVGLAWAAESVVCTVAIGTGAATVTSSPTTGTCTWNQGATVLLACDQDVYVSSTASTGAGSAPVTATSGAQRINFAGNMDPYPLYLDPADKHVSLLAVSAAGTCKFMTTKRRRPW